MRKSVVILCSLFLGACAAAPLEAPLRLDVGGLEIDGPSDPYYGRLHSGDAPSVLPDLVLKDWAGRAISVSGAANRMARLYVHDASVFARTVSVDGFIFGSGETRDGLQVRLAAELAVIEDGNVVARSMAQAARSTDLGGNWSNAAEQALLRKLVDDVVADVIHQFRADLVDRRSVAPIAARTTAAAEPGS